jgi:hypothetical protein
MLHVNWIEFELKWNSILLNSNTLNGIWVPIQLKRNVVQIGEESIENPLVNMVLEKQIKIQIWKDLISCLFTWEHIPIWNCPSDNYDLWNLRLSYLSQLQWIIFFTGLWTIQGIFKSWILPIQSKVLVLDLCLTDWNFYGGFISGFVEISLQSSWILFWSGVCLNLCAS